MTFDGRKVWICPIPENFDWPEVEAIVSRFGRVLDVHNIKENRLEVGVSARDQAIVTFSSNEEAQFAINSMAGKFIFSRFLTEDVFEISHTLELDEDTTKIPEKIPFFPYPWFSPQNSPSLSTGDSMPVEARLMGKDSFTRNSGAPSSTNNILGLHFKQSSTQSSSWPFPGRPSTGPVGGSAFPPLAPISSDTDASNGSLPSPSHVTPNIGSSVLPSVPDPYHAAGDFGGNSARIPNSGSFASPPSSSQTALEGPSSTTAPSAPTCLWEQYTTPEGLVYYYNTISSHTQWERPIPPRSSTSLAASSGGLFGSKSHATHGPPGSNLFIFHIPSEWNDIDIQEHFAMFGNIISAKVQTDVSGRNSGFGFVSFDNNASAFAAINVMNGLAVGSKFLKVQLKKGEEYYMPVNQSVPHM